jgi:hypothetical protein
MVVVAVTAVLLGTGALAKTLPFRPVLLQPGAQAPSDRSGLGAPALAPAAPGPGATATPTPPATEAEGTGPVAPVPPATAVPGTPAPTDPSASVPHVPEPVTVVYEAEDADLSGFVRLFPVEGASGGDVVGMIGLQLTNHVRFPEVTVDTAGAYELTLYYVSVPERQAMVSINDGELLTVEFPALGDGREVGSVSIPVELAAGPNAVWFGNAEAPAPALDRITVTG